MSKTASLKEICARHQMVGRDIKSGTDKDVSHAYIPIYERLLAHLVGKSPSVVEMGVASGKSLLMWEEYFQNAAILGIDIIDRPAVLDGHPSIAFKKANAGNAQALDEATTGMMFDVIIDDASHLLEDQRVAFGALFPKLKVGGHYFIEDVFGRAYAHDKYDWVTKFAGVTNLTSKRGCDHTLVIVRKDKLV